MMSSIATGDIRAQEVNLSYALYLSYSSGFEYFAPLKVNDVYCAQ